jgi:hypothetical protein
MCRMTFDTSRASSGWQATSFTAFRQSAALIIQRPRSVFNMKWRLTAGPCSRLVVDA